MQLSIEELLAMDFDTLFDTLCETVPLDEVQSHLDALCDTLPLDQLEAFCSKVEAQAARRAQAADDRIEIQRRLIDDYEMQNMDLQMEISNLRDEVRKEKARLNEARIDHGVAAAKRGEDPIEAMKDWVVRLAFNAELVKQGFQTVDIEDGEVVAVHWTPKGKKLLARIRASER